MNSEKQKSFLRETFLELFPVPKILDLPYVGLDISDEAVRFAQIHKVRSGYKLGSFGSVSLNQGVVEDGFIKDKNSLIDAISQLKKKYNLKNVRASLPEEKSYFFKIELPPMDHGEIRAAIAFKIEENVPIALKDAVYDFVILREPQEGDDHIHVGVTVLHNHVVTSYLDAINSAGLSVLSFEIESQAFSRSVIPNNFSGTCIVAMLRKTKTVISIVSKSQVQFTSTIPIGSDAIVSAITKQLGLPEKEGENIKMGKEEIASNEMFMALVNASSTLRDEMQKHIEYWNTHGNAVGDYKTIKKIFLAGADATLGLDSYLGKSLSVECLVANPWVNVISLEKNLPDITKRESLDYSTAIGLAIS